MVWNLLHIIYVYIGIQHCQFLRFESTLAIPHPRRQRDIGRSVAEEKQLSICKQLWDRQELRMTLWSSIEGDSFLWKILIRIFPGQKWLELVLFISNLFFSDSVGSSVRENSPLIFFWGEFGIPNYENFLGLSPFGFIWNLKLEPGWRNVPL